MTIRSLLEGIATVSVILGFILLFYPVAEPERVLVPVPYKFVVHLKRDGKVIEEFKAVDVPTKSGQYYRFETPNSGFVFIPAKDGNAVDWSPK